MSDYPQRFLIRIKDESGASQWRIVVRRAEAVSVREMAISEARISTDIVREIFNRCASKWPELPEGPTLQDFVDALNFLRVTKSLSVGQTGAANRERTGIDTTAVRDAIDLLALAGSKFNLLRGIYSDEEVFALGAVFQAAQAATGIIKSPPAKKREDTSVWHEAAKLIAWHIRRVLADAGQDETATGGRLSVVVAELLRLSQAYKSADTEAVRKVLTATNWATDKSCADGIEASKMHSAYEIL